MDAAEGSALYAASSNLTMGNEEDDCVQHRAV